MFHEYELYVLQSLMKFLFVMTGISIFVSIIPNDEQMAKDIMCSLIIINLMVAFLELIVPIFTCRIIRLILKIKVKRKLDTLIKTTIKKIERLQSKKDRNQYNKSYKETRKVKTQAKKETAANKTANKSNSPEWSIEHCSAFLRGIMDAREKEIINKFASMTREQFLAQDDIQSPAFDIWNNAFPEKAITTDEIMAILKNNTAENCKRKEM
jgi:hypothetical protein